MFALIIRQEPRINDEYLYLKFSSFFSIVTNFLPLKSYPYIDSTKSHICVPKLQVLPIIEPHILPGNQYKGLKVLVYSKLFAINLLICSHTYILKYKLFPSSPVFSQSHSKSNFIKEVFL